MLDIVLTRITGVQPSLCIISYSDCYVKHTTAFMVSFIVKWVNPFAVLTIIDTACSILSFLVR